MSRPFLFSAICAGAIALSGCNSGPGDDVNTDSSRRVDPPPSLYIVDTYKKPHAAQFIDSAVEGLTYYSPSIAGTTDSNGGLQYVLDEPVEFYLGTFYLGQSFGKPIITPEDLVADFNEETRDTALLQILQILQSFDADSDPSNGISISAEVANAFSNGDFNAQLGSESFLQDEALVAVLSQLTNRSDWVGEEDAMEHFENSKETFDLPE